MNFTLRGAVFSISPDDVLRVTRNVPPSPTDGRNRYFADLHGQRFPIKQVLRLVSGLPSAGFTAQDAHRILSRLGFDIFEQRPPVGPGIGTLARTNGGPTATGGRAIADGELRKLLVVFQTDEDGWEVASCPTLPGCHSQGRTREEALENVREAIRGYLASLREHDAAPPPSTDFRVIEVRV
jgi:predicted RNase H-like HicB family nuclease